MDIIYLLIPLALMLLALAIAAFLWAIRNGQFDDLEKEAHRILFEEDTEPDTVKNPPDPKTKS
ncbi:cytochrome oxidase maturation protein, cbb3-type [Gammaproteobacteria bacterium 45_16_T64]|nr:cytochrome oxidase maturation protein, cbb3-type [Gammaproteobacteria bacterium 45_16_T64]